jgi:transcriptional adapter 3
MRQDDEITAALRQCQRLLRQQLAVNDARKNRLAEVARDRLAYGDYRHTLSGLEAVITTAWQRRSSRKVRKGKSKEKEKEKEEVYVMGGKKAPGSALPDQVKKAIEARRKWIDSVGAALEGEDMEGRYKGLPTRSIYEGIDDQIRDAGAVGDK